MSLLTRCPRCRTLFRVTPAQLQARDGTVRCGRCMHAFDAYQALASERSNALGAPVQPAPVVETAASAAHASAAGSTEVQNGAAAGTNLPHASASAPDEARPATAAPGAPAAAAPRASIAARVRQRFPRRSLYAPAIRHLWWAGTAGLGLLLALQLAFAYRSELAARYPVIRSALSAVCEHAGCTVTLPQRPDLVRIEASDVHMVDAARPQLVQLTATLRSYANYDLAYPALDLVLTNANEHALARRIFTPDEYLDQTRDPQAGIAANAEITVALDLDTGNLNAAGFRLDLLPAP